MLVGFIVSPITFIFAINLALSDVMSAKNKVLLEFAG
jgi:hypothetical protein